MAIFAVGMIFGLDYLITPGGSSTVLTSVEATWAPLWVWGATILMFSVLGFVVEWQVLNREHPFLPSKRRNQWGWLTNAGTAPFGASPIAIGRRLVVVNR